MATIEHVVTQVIRPSGIKVLWETITPTNKPGGPFKDSLAFPLKCIQVTGTIGTSMDLNIEGSNDDGTTWASLQDVLGNSLDALAALGIWQIAEIPRWIRPILIAGTSQDLDVHLMCFNPSLMR